MKALRLHGHHDVRLDDVDEPKLKPGWSVIEVACANLAIIGFDADGGFAQRVAAPNYSIHRLPDGISNECGAVIEPLAVVVHAIRRGRVAPGDVIAVVGAGMIGLGTLQVARAA